MPNSCSSTLPSLPSFNTLDMLVLNTVDADVTILTNFVTFPSFFWHFLVRTIATPLTLTPAREMAPKGILTGRLMKVLNVATLNIPEATLKLLEQAFSYVSESKVLEYFSCFFLYLSSSLSNSCQFPWTTFRW